MKSSHSTFFRFPEDSSSINDGPAAFPISLALGRQAASLTAGIELQQEIETKFVVRTKRIVRALEGRKIKCERITQAYIPPELIPAVLMLCNAPSRGSYLEIIDDPRSFTCARVRNSAILGGAQKSETVLQLKSPRIARVKRSELSIKLSQEEFFRALSYATDGAMEKIRFTHSGHIIDRGGRAHKAVAHIDFIIAAGPPNSLELNPYGPHQKHPFAFVDIEVPKLGLIRRLDRPEKHSFDYLSHSINLLKSDSWLRKATRTRAISRLGFSHKLIRSALKELEKTCP